MAKEQSLRIQFVMQPKEREALNKLIARLSKERGTEQSMGTVIREAIAAAVKA